MPRRKLSIRSALVIRMAAVILVAIGVGGAYTYWQVTTEAQELGRRVINQTAVLIDQRIGTLLRRAQTQGSLLARLTLPNVGTGPQPTLTSSRFKDIATQAVEVLNVNPEFASASIVLDETGEWVQATSRSSGPAVVQTSVATRFERYAVSTFMPVFGDLLAVENGTRPTSDPRKEAAYQRCKDELRAVWSGVQLIGPRAEQSEGTPGVECLVPLLDADDKFVGVAKIALSLENLGVYLLNTKVGESGFAFLTELDRDGKVKIVADPQPQNNARRNTVDLLAADEVQDPIRKEVLLATADQNLSSDQTSIVRFRAAGQDYIGGLKLVSETQGPPWAMVIVAPEGDFLASTRRTVLFFVTFGLLAVAVGTAVSLLLARRFAEPLQHLARETSRIRSLELDESPVPTTRIREIDELSVSVEAMKSGLRSMEKLVPTEYARHLIATGQEAKLGGERRHITVYFGDIVGFTRLSHQLPPEELFSVLTEYLDILSNEVEMFQGTIDKFNGDDVMAFWGAPTVTADHAVRAVQCALASVESLECLHTEWRELGRPVLSASFGIATGDVIVGNVGNQRRMNYTVIGDSVNLASRLQSLNKFYGTHILIGQQTRREAGDRLLCRTVDIVAVFNRQEPERIYEPIATADKASPVQIAFVQTHDLAFDAYEKRQWAKAAKLFEEVLAMDPEDGPAAILHARSLEFLRTPPPSNWNGANELGFK